MTYTCHARHYDIFAIDTAWISVFYDADGAGFVSTAASFSFLYFLAN